jgi:hypothetical protein
VLAVLAMAILHHSTELRHHLFRLPMVVVLGVVCQLV